MNRLAEVVGWKLHRCEYVLRRNDAVNVDCLSPNGHPRASRQILAAIVRRVRVRRAVCRRVALS